MREILHVMFLALSAAGPALHARSSQGAFLTPSDRPHVEQRLLPLEGGQNFRDLGGYQTGDGRHVRWGLLYRSGSMHHLTPSDFKYLHQLGIRTVCDLRDNRERANEPVAWPTGRAPTVFARDYLMEQTDIGIPTSTRRWTVQHARAVMRDQYTRILPRFAPQYRQMFSELLAGHAPLAFNCSAGKDRTGVAAALLLTALGVSRRTVVQDYLLSNQYLDTQRALQAAKDGAGEWKTLPDGVLRVFLSVDRSFLDSMFQMMTMHKGGVAGYLRSEMGLGAKEIKQLRAMYTE